MYSLVLAQLLKTLIPRLSEAVSRSNGPRETKLIEEIDPFFRQGSRFGSGLCLDGLLHLLVLLALRRHPNTQSSIDGVSRRNIAVAMLLLEIFQLIVMLGPVVSERPDKPKIVQASNAVFGQTAYHWLAQCLCLGHLVTRGSFRTRASLVSELLFHFLVLDALRIDPGTKFGVLFAPLWNQAILHKTIFWLVTRT